MTGRLQGFVLPRCDTGFHERFHSLPAGQNESLVTGKSFSWLWNYFCCLVALNNVANSFINNAVKAPITKIDIN